MYFEAKWVPFLCLSCSGMLLLSANRFAYTCVPGMIADTLCSLSNFCRPALFFYFSNSISLSLCTLTSSSHFPSLSSFLSLLQLLLSPSLLHFSRPSSSCSSNRRRLSSWRRPFSSRTPPMPLTLPTPPHSSKPTSSSSNKTNRNPNNSSSSKPNRSKQSKPRLHRHSWPCRSQSSSQHRYRQLERVFYWFDFSFMSIIINKSKWINWLIFTRLY